MKRWCAVFGLAAALVSSGCAVPAEGQGADEAAAEAGAPEEGGESGAAEALPAPTLKEEFLGEINYVNREGGFVLIEGSTRPDFEPGEKLIARSMEGASAGILVLSPERNRQYLIGDIISGYPQVADRVYYERSYYEEASGEKEPGRDQRRGSKSKNSETRRFGRR